MVRVEWLQLAEVEREQKRGKYSEAGWEVQASARAALGLTPHGWLPQVDDLYLGPGWVGIRVDACTCGVGGVRGHELGCGLEFLGRRGDVAVDLLAEAAYSAGLAEYRELYPRTTAHGEPL